MMYIKDLSVETSSSKLFHLKASFIKIGPRFLGQCVLEVFHVKDEFRNKSAIITCF